MREYKLYINGEWLETKSGKIIDDINPATGEVYAKVHTAGPEEVELAISSAEKASKGWAKLVPEERERILLKAADYMEANVPDIADRLIDESGSTFLKTMGEIMESIAIFRAAAGECRRIDGGVVPADSPDQLSYWVRQPYGVVAGIAPFNYPLLLALNKVVYGLACGNAFILKPASATPISGLIIAECLEAAGVPAGVFNVIPGAGSVVGDALVEDPRVKVIAFTGSTAVGRAIAQKASGLFKKYALEMGGKNPMIVLKDFDVDKAVKIAGFGSYFHQGQICMIGSRIIVEEPIYDEFVEKMTARVKAFKMGDPHSPETVIGPLIDDKQYKVLDAHIADAVAKGARLMCGGGHEGYYYEASLLADVTPEMEVFYEESFGPMTSIVKAKDAEDALRLCNDNHYGLSSALLTNDISKAIDMSLRMEAGMVHVNDATVMGSRRAPFGGVKGSGVGREDSAFSVEEFTELKWITIQYKDKEYPV